MSWACCKTLSWLVGVFLCSNKATQGSLLSLNGLLIKDLATLTADSIFPFNLGDVGRMNQGVILSQVKTDETRDL